MFVLHWIVGERHARRVLPAITAIGGPPVHARSRATNVYGCSGLEDFVGR
jgi:hypothetical protein